MSEPAETLAPTKQEPPMTIESYPVRNRWTGAIQFTAGIECDPAASPRIKLGLAVRWAVKARARLAGADLTGARLTRARLADADLAGADLAGARLTRARLTDADLTGTRLTDADLAGADLAGADLAEKTLRPFKSDLWMTLTAIAKPAEVQFLIGALRAGGVDGSSYGQTGNPCACLVGTIARARGLGSGELLDHGAGRPAERWFMMIRPGDAAGKLVDGKETGGGFAARLALEWTLEWCALTGVDPYPVQPEPERAG